jgi:hypothetical protein
VLVKSGTWKTTEASGDHFVALTAKIVVLKEVNATYKSITDRDQTKRERRLRKTSQGGT